MKTYRVRVADHVETMPRYVDVPADHCYIDGGAFVFQVFTRDAQGSAIASPPITQAFGPSAWRHMEILEP